MKWGMDIIGTLLIAPTQKCFLLVLTDYYSKWITVEAYASIKDKDVQMFMWNHIICQFNIPKEIVIGNGSQFFSNEFKEFCEY